jgi:hypothetical protein
MRAAGSLPRSSELVLTARSLVASPGDTAGVSYVPEAIPAANMAKKAAYGSAGKQSDFRDRFVGLIRKSP